MGLPIAATKTAHPATPNPWELPGSHSRPSTDAQKSSASRTTFFRGSSSARNVSWQRDASSGEVIAIWGKRDGGFASNVVMAGENVLVEISNNSHRGDGLRLLRVPDALKQRLSNAAKGAMR